MKKKQRFLISYICNNQPNTMEISCDRESLDVDEVKKYIAAINASKAAVITDIRIASLHRSNNPDVHPGHYQ